MDKTNASTNPVPSAIPAVSQGNAGPPQVSLTATGGGLGVAPPWGRSEAASQPREVGPEASSSLVSSLASTALALCFVLALAWLVLRFIKKLQSGKAKGGGLSDEIPRVLRSVPLGQRERLTLVRYRGCEYLLGVTTAAVNVIDTLAIGARSETDGHF